MKETLSPWGLQRVILCPKGWILTGWNVYQPDGQRILYQDLSAFIRVHPVKMHFLASITQPKWQQQDISIASVFVSL